MLNYIFKSNEHLIYIFIQEVISDDVIFYKIYSESLFPIYTDVPNLSLVNKSKYLLIVDEFVTKLEEIYPILKVFDKRKLKTIGDVSSLSNNYELIINLKDRDFIPHSMIDSSNKKIKKDSNNIYNIHWELPSIESYLIKNYFLKENKNKIIMRSKKYYVGVNNKEHFLTGFVHEMNGNNIYINIKYTFVNTDGIIILSYYFNRNKVDNVIGDLIYHEIYHEALFPMTSDILDSNNTNKDKNLLIVEGSDEIGPNGFVTKLERIYPILKMFKKVLTLKNLIKL